MADLPAGRGRGIVRRIYANLGLLIGGKAAAGLISLVYMMIAARALGPADYGVLILVHGYAMAVGGIVEFPGWHAIVRYGAQALEASDRGRLIRLLRFAAGIEAIGGMASVVVAAALAPLIGPRLGWSAEAQGFATLYAFAVLASIRATPAGYLQLVGRFDLLGAHGVVAPLVRLAGATVAALAGAGLRGFLVAWLIAALAEWLAMWGLGWWVARVHVAGHRLIGRATGARRENPGIWRFMIAANADITFTELSGRMVPLVIGWVMGPVAAGLYAIAQRAGVVIQQPAQILGQAAYAEFARLVAGGGTATGAALRLALWRCIALALAMASPAVLAMTIAARPLAVLLGGSAFAGAAVLIGWLASARLILVAAPPIGSALVALGRPGWSVLANIAASLLCLAMLPPVLLRLGLVGAGVQAGLQAVATVLLLVFLLHRATADDGARRPAMAQP
jgi:O-antigen/teichoic acid export membrane protein